MAKVNINTIKNWFRNGLKPTQKQFWSWMDSYWHKDENIPTEKIEGLDDLVAGKADSEQLSNHVDSNDAHGIPDVRQSIATAVADATTKANAAQTGAVSDIRDGVALAYNTLSKLYTWALSLFNTKVDKEDGKGLSTEDYTSEEKMKLEALENVEYTIDIVANQLKLYENGTETGSVDLSIYMDDTNLARIVSGTYDSTTGMATFTRDDNTTFTLELSNLSSELTVINSDGDEQFTTNRLSFGEYFNFDVANKRILQPVRFGKDDKNNAFLGNYALFNNTTGQYNNAFGYHALYKNTTGRYNNAFGDSALFNNTTGSFNVAFGNSALYNNTTGHNNNAFGNKALYSNTTGHNNIAFGDNALLNNTTGNFNNVFGHSALSKNTTGHRNNVFGNYALHNNTIGEDNNAFGFQALHNNTIGEDNNAFGFQALFDNTIGEDNNAFGNKALSNNTIGSYNNAFGYHALYKNTTGRYNNAFGDSALFNNTTGSFNVAFGNSALYNNTTGHNNNAFGNKALSNNTIGSYNNAFGYRALGGIEFGERNVAFGANAGFSLVNTNSLPTSLSQCVYIGADTKVSADGVTNENVFGYLAEGKGSNTVSLGNSNVTKLFIGNTLAIDKTAIVAAADGTSLVIRDVGGVKTITV